MIIVDDKGSDKSIDIARDYEKRCENIRVLENERNLGTLATRKLQDCPEAFIFLSLKLLLKQILSLLP
ncbi:glycosyltransferase [Campylobacter avium]|uniref:glycosyltransferase n=1 Tax=Campylobacter avium TaxID=522485 RepID=UPI0032EA77B5